jgi:hypothetical protein
MNTFYFVYEVNPKPENPVIGHASKAVAHIWVSSGDMDEARDKALHFLTSAHWDVTKENKARQQNPEQLEELNAQELSNYQKAQSEGLHADFYYWHRSD